MTPKKKTNQAKYIQNLYAELYEMLMTEIKDDLNKWRNMLCAVIMKLLNVTKMLLFPNLICGLIVIPVKIPESFFLVDL